ncbi:Fe-S cluster assembly sulfur transfer protein SufU [Spiroplasma platyhelix]|uniref:SUF system NifU family Fe-S cluster assembly protein n=1 Tax=Spiroplasma platyhelix PALS-1 TaxID=1276218 RepID=A0A846TWL8_9MOLU|nr:SUF system NifU family Fe-S cluster assembly protein [Spiroplasma platyhelix]MBE4704051.1 Zinc-dependent sulfurtransferase SufU [Spiroplasma platyhelix PALS-1]NKE38421.1 SUF system NifU family Fe-S cluster assembly protein [Spiroplasma platyhelix PALS-1]UJB29309.1 FeS assembly protein [Spiroplasma platyhelix PALS-1]
MNSLIKDNNYYRQIIVDHYSNPINKGILKTKESLTFHHYSNSCVDDFYFEITFNKNVVANAKFEGIGCAISTASIDIFASLIINKTIAEVLTINENYQNMLAAKKYQENILEDLLAFKNVLKQPNRIRCALIISESINEILLVKQGKK